METQTLTIIPEGGYLIYQHVPNPFINSKYVAVQADDEYLAFTRRLNSTVRSLGKIQQKQKSEISDKAMILVSYKKSYFRGIFYNDENQNKMIHFCDEGVSMPASLCKIYDIPEKLKIQAAFARPLVLRYGSTITGELISMTTQSQSVKKGA